MTDRSSTRKDLKFNQAAFDEGYYCRTIDGDPVRDNPYANDQLTAGRWLDKSFRAGYADADIDPEAPWNGGAIVAALSGELEP